MDFNSHVKNNIWPPRRWPQGSSFGGFQTANIIFDVKIEILTLTNLYLDIFEGIPKYNLPICTWLASSRNLDPNKNQKLASKSSHICCIGIKIYQKNGYIQYESGILMCLLVIFWSLANENYFFVVFNFNCGLFKFCGAIYSTNFKK